MEIELIFFRVQNQQFGVEIKSINRIVNKKNKRQLGEIPLIDSVDYLHLNNHKAKVKKEVAPRAEVIIIELDGVKKGILVDEILRISALNVDKVKLIPSFIRKTAQRDYFWAIAQVEQELIPLLDVRKLVGNQTIDHRL